MDTTLLLSGVAKTLESSAPSYSRSKCALAQQFLGPKFRKQREAYAHALPREMFSHVVLARAKENRTQISNHFVASYEAKQEVICGLQFTRGM